MNALLICLLLSACYSPPDTYQHDCALRFYCESELVGSTSFPVCGTHEDITAWQHDWSQACALIAAGYLQSGRCEYTLCAARCERVDDAPDSCEGTP